MTSEIGARYPSQAIRILALMVESGMLYILIGVSSALVHYLARINTSSLFVSFALQVTALASLVIRLPFGTLGDIFMPVAVQLVVRNNFKGMTLESD
jgi:hypothetical protein